MNFAEAITNVRSGTLHDADDQFTDPQLLSVLAGEYRRQRRWLCTYVPALCEAVVSGIVVTQVAPYILKSLLASFERVVMVEILNGATYSSLEVPPSLRRSNPEILSFYEQPAQLLITPATAAAGTYQVTYLAGAPATIAETTVMDLPGGLEDVVIERGCMWARQRHNEDYGYHEKAAARIEADAYSQLRSRYGNHGQPALRRERR